MLPAARGLARQFGAAVTLLHVVERRPPSAVHGDRHLATIAEAGGYLQGLAAQVFSGLPVRTHVHGPEDIDVAASIARHADEMEVGLIVLCTHGGGGARELLFGSVAQQVLGRGSVPVLLMRSEGAGEAFTCERILVPLDGSESSEAVLLLPSATAASLEIEKEATRSYLGGLAGRSDRRRPDRDGDPRAIRDERGLGRQRRDADHGQEPTADAPGAGARHSRDAVGPGARRPDHRPARRGDHERRGRRPGRGLAEEVGFEPTRRASAQRFSRPSGYRAPELLQ